MKRVLLIVAMCFCGLFGLAKIWALIFLRFSTRQAIAAGLLLVSAGLLFDRLRSSRPER